MRRRSASFSHLLIGPLPIDASRVAMLCLFQIICVTFLHDQDRSIMASLVPGYSSSSDSASSSENDWSDVDEPPTKSACLQDEAAEICRDQHHVLSSSESSSQISDSSDDASDTSQRHPASPQVASSSQTQSAVKGKTYAMKFNELPSGMRDFLNAVNTFFTRAVNLERQTPPLKNSTYSKAQERILGTVRHLCSSQANQTESRIIFPVILESVRLKIDICISFITGFLGFLHARLKIELTPEVFLRTSILEQYLDYLQVST